MLATSRRATATRGRPLRKFNRAFDLLDAFGPDQRALPAALIAARAGVPRTTAYRLLADLVERGYLVLDAARQAYLLGPRLAELGLLVDGPTAVTAACRSIVDELKLETGLFSSLVVRLGDHAVAAYAAPLPFPFALRLDAAPPTPLAIGAAGRAILAFLPVEERQRLTRREVLDGAASPAPQAPEALLRLLEETRTSGLARSAAEIIPGTASVAAPVFDARGAAVASVSLLAFGHRAEELLDAQMEAALLRAARACTHRVSRCGEGEEGS